jgi:twitching motility protein PilT
MSQNTRTSLTVVENAPGPVSDGDSKSLGLPYDMRYLVKALLKYEASDLHLRAGRPPLFRVNGKLMPAKMAEISGNQVVQLFKPLMVQRQIEKLESERQIDFSFSFSEFGRFRCNLFYQRGTLSAAVRRIPPVAPDFEKMGLPPVLKTLIDKSRGILLVTGATGSGKSTTLAALAQYLNQHQSLHILTLEDPIEYVYQDHRSTFSQRELGSDVISFQEGLASGLRQDPDVIVIGEIRTREMIEAALTAAETGHLVLTTLHTNDARGSIERIIDVFPAESKNQIRMQLANCLIGVIAQNLVESKDQKSRVMAHEILVNSPTVSEVILRNELEKIQDIIAASTDYYQMCTLNMSLERLLANQQISEEVALRTSSNPDDLRLRLSGVRREQGYVGGESSSDPKFSARTQLSVHEIKRNSRK